MFDVIRSPGLSLGLGLLFGAALPAQGAMRHGPVHVLADHACVAPVEERAMARELAAYARSPGWLPGPASDALYPFYPMAGTPGGDLAAVNYNDLDASSGLLDWSCDNITYDGHDASDVLLRSFGEQDAGVPVFAVLDGRVTSVADGYFDRNINWNNTEPANRVTIDHGGGLVCHYLHFKKNSVLVTANQIVRAGQQLALTGSSGRSSWPHLHFATRVNGARREPFRGACNSGPGLWRNQPDFDHTLRVWDFGVSRIDPSTVGAAQEPSPVGGKVALGDARVYVWTQALFVPVQSTVRYRFWRPDQTLAHDSGPLSLGNAVRWKMAKWSTSWDIADMHRITGTWRVQMDINGVPFVDGPIEVVADSGQFRNRAPHAVTVSLDAAAPAADDPIYCRVTVDLVNDDDYDLLSYRYRWYVTGELVRDVTHAGEADAIRSGLAQGGDFVECVVTATDGVATSADARASATVSPSPWTDVGLGKSGVQGVPVATGRGSLIAASPLVLTVQRGHPAQAALFLISDQRGDVPFAGGTVVPFPITLSVPVALDASGDATLATRWPSGVPGGATLFVQAWILDPTASFGFSASNGVRGVAQVP